MADLNLGTDGVDIAIGTSDISGSLDSQLGCVGSISGISNLPDNSLTVVPEVFSNSAAKKWYDMLVRKGINATVRTYPAATFSPDTNKTTLRNVREFSIKIVPPYRNVKEEYNTTTLITSGRGLTGFANYLLSFVVKAGIKLVINEKEWTVISVSPIQDSSGILFYTLGIESGN